MLEHADRTRLLAEALAHNFVCPRQQHLQRHRPAKDLVGGAINRGHGAAAQARLDLKMAELPTDETIGFKAGWRCGQ
jgi:hypothetical protein